MALAFLVFICDIYAYIPFYLLEKCHDLKKTCIAVSWFCLKIFLFFLMIMQFSNWRNIKVILQWVSMSTVVYFCRKWTEIFNCDSLLFIEIQNIDVCSLLALSIGCHLVMYPVYVLVLSIANPVALRDMQNLLSQVHYIVDMKQNSVTMILLFADLIILRSQFKIVNIVVLHFETSIQACTFEYYKWRNSQQ